MDGLILTIQRDEGVIVYLAGFWSPKVDVTGNPLREKVDDALGLAPVCVWLFGIFTR
jgi:hypothetical protein